MIKSLLFILFLCSAVFAFAQNRTIDLQGAWRFEIDRNDVGEKEHWFATKLKDKVTLPGSMTENRKGDEVTLETKWTGLIYDSTFYSNPRLAEYRTPENLKIPFWLTPVKYYVGAAWYQRDVNVSAEWKKQNVSLFLERPHTETKVWINDKEVGIQNTLSVPHVFDIGNYLRAGNNTITIRVDNRIKDIDVGVNSHSIADHTQGNWNGIAGRIELQSKPKTYLEDIQIYPDIKGKKAFVNISVRGTKPGTVSIEAESFNSEREHHVEAVSHKFNIKNNTADMQIELPMGNDFLIWDEFNPNLYKLKVSIQTPDGTDVKEIRFGMREFTIDGRWFYVNGRKTQLRGTLECCVFPLTGYPPTDVDSWLRIFRICRDYGLNHIRFHSYCPPEAAMEAADLAGFYLQPEGPTWPNHSSSLGNGFPVDDYLWEEAHKIIKYYGNYPSFCMFAIGNEPRGRWVEWVSKWVNYWKEKDTRRVYTGASVGGSWAWQPHNQYHVRGGGVKGLAWKERPESNSDYRSRMDTVRQPLVSHETGQWCVFPDFTEIRKYTGVMRAHNFEMFRDDLKKRNMGDLSAGFLKASGKLQALCYKHEIEKTLRTPDYAGFQLLGLNDFPGQGSAIVGLLNAFWEEKGYINGEEFRRFCAPTVLLSRMDKFVFENNETLKAHIEVSHFGEKPFSNVITHWELKDATGGISVKGKLPAKNLQTGNCQKLGTIEIPLQFVTKAQKFNLEVYFDNPDVTNNWDVWVYPAHLQIPGMDDVHVTDTVDEKTKEILSKGGKVLLLLAGKVEQGKDVIQHMTPSSWNTSWFKMRPPHTEGTLINDFHPVFKDFPTDFYTGLQWWELICNGQIMELNSFPANFQPVIQPVDTWFINRKLGILFETNVGKGKILVCSADITSDWETRPVARQLYYSIAKYMNSHLFIPEHSLDISLIEDIMKKEGERLNIKNTDAPDELKNVIL
ncbi:MAG: beta-glucuronidase [Dysgonamonadaceae bacterium]|jgi:hypothetical protein|nr:beta-glucuronidase [Dysgonamonadaceae bacterium]